jgi:hypothetical protein
MEKLFADTHPDAERFLINLLRKAPFSKRLGMAASLAATTRRLSWMGLRQRYPDEPPSACMERFVFYLYGDKELARKAVFCFTCMEEYNKVLME